MEIVKGILDKIADLFQEFTWPRLFALLSAGILMFILATLYERYTSSFLLGRLQRSAELVAKIQQIELTITNASPALRQDYDALLAQASGAIKDKPFSLGFIPSTLRFSLDSISKFFAGGAVWFFFALIALVRPSGSDNPEAAFSGLVVLGVCSGLVAIAIPAIWWPWFHIFMLPFIVAVVVILMFVPVVYFTGKRNRK